MATEISSTPLPGQSLVVLDPSLMLAVDVFPCEDRQAIGDVAAIKFATGFYDVLGAGRLIEECFEVGYTLLDLLLIPQNSTPVLKALCDDPTERQIFIENLIHAAGDRSGSVSVIITLRSHFFGETRRHPSLNQAIAKLGVIVPSMSTEELRRASCVLARLKGDRHTSTNSCESL